MSTEPKRQVNIEIQILPTESMPERTLYYWSKMYASQLRAGDTYDQLKKCITINIVDFECTPLQQVHSCYHLREDRRKHRLTDVLEIHFLELPKLLREDVNAKADDVLLQWLLFIDGRSKEVLEMLAHKNQDIATAYDLLKIISREERSRMAYEARKAELMDQRSRIKSALVKGEQIGFRKGERIVTMKIIRALLADGMDAPKIAAITGVDLNTVSEIQHLSRIED